MEEIWKDVKGFEGHYMVSNLGRVKSVIGFCRKGNRNKILSSGPDNKYQLVVLCKDSNKHPIRVHALVAKAFIPNPENKPYVNHINGIKHDNRLENLEWVTKSENELHAHRTGLKAPLRGERNHLSQLLLNVATGIYYYSFPQAAESVGVCDSTFRARFYSNRTNFIKA